MIKKIEPVKKENQNIGNAEKARLLAAYRSPSEYFKAPEKFEEEQRELDAQIQIQMEEIFEAQFLKA